MLESPHFLHFFFLLNIKNCRNLHVQVFLKLDLGHHVYPVIVTQQIAKSPTECSPITVHNRVHKDVVVVDILFQIAEIKRTVLPNIMMAIFA